ncbi:riboflavin synthase subunit alpha [Deltaproteobacteria bacterium TL4]
MFTGIVQGTRPVEKITDLEGRRRLKIKLSDLSKNLQRGASVGVNGVCLTVVSIEDECAEFDIIKESLDRTNLGQLKVGDQVDIERACRYGDEVGGHQVTGHVDTVGTIEKKNFTPNNCEVYIHHAEEWNKYLVPKGWIAVDGISLTVVAVTPTSFSVCLIPETLQQTVLGIKTEGASLNLEFDHTTKVIVQTMERLIPQYLNRSLKEGSLEVRVD